MKPTPQQRDSILAKLREPIWVKPKPPPKPRSTWKGRRLGDRIERGGLIYEIDGVDSDGISIRMVVPFKATTPRRVESPEELATFTRVPKPKAPRKAKTKKEDE